MAGSIGRSILTLLGFFLTDLTVYPDAVCLFNIALYSPAEFPTLPFNWQADLS